MKIVKKILIPPTKPKGEQTQWFIFVSSIFSFDASVFLLEFQGVLVARPLKKEMCVFHI